MAFPTRVNVTSHPWSDRKARGTWLHYNPLQLEGLSTAPAWQRWGSSTSRALSRVPSHTSARPEICKLFYCRSLHWKTKRLTFDNQLMSNTAKYISLKTEFSYTSSGSSIPRAYSICVKPTRNAQFSRRTRVYSSIDSTSLDSRSSSSLGKALNVASQSCKNLFWRVGPMDLKKRDR